MPKLKPTDRPLSKKEEEQVTAGIARDSDNPEWTKADFSRAEAGYDFFARLGIKPPRPRGRPLVPNPKKHVSLRLDADVLDALRAEGKGWQTRVNSMLRVQMGLAGKE